MPTIPANGGVEICYEILEATSPPEHRSSVPILLIQGLAGQLISWDDDFCGELCSRGFPVIRFDNRDVGESEKFSDAGMPDLAAAMSGKSEGIAYSLSDMASDAAGLLEALQVSRAHVVGVSMGGMIAQTLALDFPDRVASLTSIMSTTGNRSVGMPTPEGLEVIFTPPPQDRHAVIESQLKIWRVLWGSGYPLEEERVATRAGRLFDRCNYPEGVARQVAAIMSQPDRTDRLAKLRLPALVIHGDEDPLVGFSGGEATAAAIPGARLITLSGVGHVLPQPLWGQVCDAIAALASGAPA